MKPAKAMTILLSADQAEAPETVATVEDIPISDVVRAAKGLPTFCVVDVFAHLASATTMVILSDMTKHRGIRNSSDGKLSVKVRKTSASRSFKTKFGSVIVTGTKPSAESVKANVNRSTEALERVTRKLMKPGISLRAKKDVPQFSVAEDEPGVFIRRLNGRIERGRVVAGVFKAID